MDDRHSSGAQLPTAPASDASYAQSAYGDGDPLFGSHPGGYAQGAYDTGGHPTDAYGTGSYPTTGYDTAGHNTTGYDTAGHNTTGYDTAGHNTAGYDTAAYGSTGYDPYAHTGYDAPGYGTGGTAPYDAGYDTAAYGGSGSYDSAAHGSGAAYDTTAYDTGGYSGYDTGSFATGGFDGGAYGTGSYDTGSYGTGAAYGTGDDLTGGYPTGSYPTGSYATAGYDTGYGTAAYDSGAFAAAATAVQEPIDYEATAVWSTTDYTDYTGRSHDPAPGVPAPGIPAQAGPPAADTVQWDEPLVAFTHETGDDDAAAPPGAEAATADSASIAEAMTQAMPVTSLPDDDAPAGQRVSGPPAGKAVRGGNRGRRRQAKRSALLTVAVPSVAAMGVCAAAAASVSQFGGDSQDSATTQAAPDAGSAKRTTAANKKLDSQLAGLSASAQDFRERASRTQERLDLKQRQSDERKRKEAEAARKEALRPKFVLPVTQHGLSALFGQAGVNWMSVHTGIDFPVSYGTTVMAATDGTIRTQWNSAYGNMAILTAPDGTETWYCHLSSTKIRSGSVKAGDTIAYSGNSGNSTGPHLHFEVRPGGGAAVDPIPWLRAHDLNPY
ncbi:peptidoglycan DD-metalloendopeptidase family protein [Streptomyces sp. NPDC058000]|uniref:M23 family metallopeptidase n=1 Tax=Streptomyces sp. NPDC058000 TaxID=3346299 RepID=UPI0036E87A9F